MMLKLIRKMSFISVENLVLKIVKKRPQNDPS
jgi:hypothetical protein